MLTLAMTGGRAMHADELAVVGAVEFHLPVRVVLAHGLVAGRHLFGRQIVQVCYRVTFQNRKFVVITHTLLA